MKKTPVSRLDAGGVFECGDAGASCPRIPVPDDPAEAQHRRGGACKIEGSLIVLLVNVGLIAVLAVLRRRRKAA